MEMSFIISSILWDAPGLFMLHTCVMNCLCTHVWLAGKITLEVKTTFTISILFVSVVCPHHCMHTVHAGSQSKGWTLPCTPQIHWDSCHCILLFEHSLVSPSPPRHFCLAFFFCYSPIGTEFSLSWLFFLKDYQTLTDRCWHGLSRLICASLFSSLVTHSAFTLGLSYTELLPFLRQKKICISLFFLFSYYCWNCSSSLVDS